MLCFRGPLPLPPFPPPLPPHPLSVTARRRHSSWPARRRGHTYLLAKRREHSSWPGVSCAATALSSPGVGWPQLDVGAFQYSPAASLSCIPSSLLAVCGLRAGCVLAPCCYGGCRYHPSLFTGGEISKAIGFVRQSAAPEDQVTAVLGRTGLIRFWDCCGATDPDAQGCTKGRHAAYGD